MADHTHIEWTDATWQIVTGCSVVSPGCTNCYAMRLAGTRLQHHPSRAGLTRDTKAGPVWTGEVRFNKAWLDQPIRWRRPRKIFVAAHGDLFADGVKDEWIDQIFAIMALCPQHTFQVLTKRPERMRQWLEERWQPAPAQTHVFCGQRFEVPPEMKGETRRTQVERACEDILSNLGLDDPDKDYLWSDEGGLKSMQWTWPLSNVWLGTSVEDQKRADERREPLNAVATAGWLTWVSYEPALGPVDWRGWEFLRWLVSGGESGPGARVSHPDWHRRSRDFCASNRIAYHFKQWGQWREPIDGEEYDTSKGRLATPPAFLVSQAGTVHCFEESAGADPIVMLGVGKKRAGRLLDGIEQNGYPEITR